MNSPVRSRTPEYATWHGMRQRCNNPRNKRYADYGGRGLRVCERWESSFEAFFSDMGPRPPGLSLDRRENERGYDCGACPDCSRRGASANCRWATKSVQSANQRPRSFQTVWAMHTHDGVTKSTTEWARQLGTTTSAFAKRVNKWGVAEAVSRPLRPKKPNGQGPLAIARAAKEAQ